MNRIISILLLIAPIHCIAQNYCKCGKYPDIPTDSIPDTIVNIANNKSFAICGSFDYDLGEKLISEFTVTLCGEQNALKFYDALKNYRIEVKEGAMVLTDLRMLPMGESHSFIAIPWASDYYYVIQNNKSLRDSCIISRNVNYGLKQLIKIDTAFMDSLWTSNLKMKYLLNEELIGLVFLAAISDQKAYLHRFLFFTDTFSIDGEYAEYYNELRIMFEEWIQN